MHRHDARLKLAESLSRNASDLIYSSNMALDNGLEDLSAELLYCALQLQNLVQELVKLGRKFTIPAKDDAEQLQDELPF